MRCSCFSAARSMCMYVEHTQSVLCCYGWYHDVDMVDAATTILVQLYRVHLLPYDALEAFSKAREDVLNYLMLT
jgi:hypothetical protein